MSLFPEERRQLDPDPYPHPLPPDRYPDLDHPETGPCPVPEVLSPIGDLCRHNHHPAVVLHLLVDTVVVVVAEEEVEEVIPIDRIIVIVGVSGDHHLREIEVHLGGVMRLDRLHPYW